MPRIKKFNKHSFKGNRFSRKGSCRFSISDQSNSTPTTETRPSPVPTSSHGPIPSTSTCRPSPKKTSLSFKKLSKSKLSQKFDCDDDNVNFIANLQLVSELVNGFVKCKFCDAEKCISMKLDSNYTNGLTHKMGLHYTNYQESTSSCTSSFVRKLPEVNTRFVYALRSIGCGIAAGKTFTPVMNLAPPNT